MGLTLAQALRLHNPSKSVAFVGAGGKTNALFQLARQLSPSAIVTTTTHFGKWQVSLGTQHRSIETLDDLKKIQFSGVTVVTGPMNKDNRTNSVSSAALEWLHEYSEANGYPLLIEADGSRQKPLKAPADHEPAIPDFVDMVVVLVGLSGLNRPLDENHVHRPEIFARLSGTVVGGRITGREITRVLVHQDGGLKNIPPAAKRVVLLNQAGTPDAQASAQGMVRGLLTQFDAVVIADLAQERIYAVHEGTAGIILAAGESSRFGSPKQLLDWRGEPFVRAVAKTAIESGLAPVVLVTGANGEQVEASVRDLPLIIVRNTSWQQGQSSSLKSGLLSLRQLSAKNKSTHSPDVGGAVFLLADQPQIPGAVIRALIAHHSTGLFPIVAPLVLMEQRANPVLFDRITFSDLMTLEGDVGGRGIFSKHRVEYLPWHDDSLLLDVDRPEDFPRIKDLE